MALTTTCCEPLSEIPLAKGSGGFTRFAFHAMGTDCKVEFESSSRPRAQAFKTEVLDWLTHFENQFSRFKPESLISRINTAAGKEWISIDEEALSLFALCDRFHWTTHGILDPTSLPLLALWDYHVQPKTIPSGEQVRQALDHVGWERFQRDGDRVFLPEPGMGLDVGGIGKEYAVDRVMEMAREAGIANCLVDFGHDLRVRGEPPEKGPWRIGLEDPNDPSRCWGGASIQDRAVTSSGDYFRNFQIDGKTYGHIIDPRTGFPVRNGCHSVTVIAPTCSEAGILSTTAFVLGPQEGLAFLDSTYQIEGCLWVGTHRLQTRRFNEYLIA